MKKIKRLLFFLIVLALAFVALHLVLKHRLSSVVQEHVLPLIEDKTHLKTQLGGASINLLEGTAELQDFKLLNAPGLQESDLLSVGDLDLKVGLKSLLNGGMAEVSHANIDQVVLTIVRDQYGLINVQQLMQTLQGPSPAGGGNSSGSGPNNDTGDLSPTRLPKARVAQADLNTVIEYIDYQSDPPFKLRLTTKFSLSDVHTGMPVRYAADGGPGEDWANISVTGGLVSSTNLFSTSLHGRMAPITDPTKLSFELHGDISKIQVDVVRKYLHKAHIDCQGMSLRLHLSCRDGVFDPNNSSIEYVMENVVLLGEYEKMMPKEIKSLPVLILPVALRGDITAPRPDAFLANLGQALYRNYRENLPVVAPALINNWLEDKYGDKMSPEDLQNIQNAFEQAFQPSP